MNSQDLSAELLEGGPPSCLTVELILKGNAENVDTPKRHTFLGNSLGVIHEISSSFLKKPK